MLAVRFQNTVTLLLFFFYSVSSFRVIFGLVWFRFRLGFSVSISCISTITTLSFS